MMQPTVFMSHAHADRAVGARYSAALRQLGLTVADDSDDDATSEGDVGLSDAKQQLLSGCSTLVVLLSPAAVSSNRVNREVETFRALAAADASHLLLPVRIAPCESPLLTTPGLHVIDATAQPFERTTRQIALVASIGRLGVPTSSAGRPAVGALGQFGLSRIARRTVIKGVVLIGGCIAAGAAAVWYEGFFVRPLLTYTGHRGVVTSLAWSPNSRRIASSSEDKTVQICDASSGSWILTYTGHAEQVLCVAWSPDGRRIASGGDGAQIWDAASGKRLLTYPGQASSHISCVAWSPDGRKIVSIANDSGDNIQIWDAASGQRLLGYSGGDTPGAYALAWSPDGRKIASGGTDAAVEVWRAP